MITKFPLFTKLDISHKAEVEAITRGFDPYSDFSFINLFTWSMGRQTEISLLGDNLVVHIPDYTAGKVLMCSLMGDDHVDEAIRELLRLNGQLIIVPEVVVQSINDPSRFMIVEDRDNYDYIYDVKALASLSGAKFKKQRNKVNRFMNDLGVAVSSYTTGTVDISVAAEMKELFWCWAAEHNKSTAETKTEQVAIETMLNNSGLLNLLFTLVRVNGKLCAFSVNEICLGGNAICHFEKALLVHEGLYSYVIQFTAKELESRGARRVNWQQDLGLPGLRHAKMSYHPSSLLKKYSVFST